MSYLHYSRYSAKLVYAFHSARNPINVTAPFRNTGAIIRLEESGIPTACVDIFIDPFDIQEDSDPLAAIEEHDDKSTVTVPWLQLLDAEAAVLSDKSE
jgi:hypothetical protein